MYIGSAFERSGYVEAHNIVNNQESGFSTPANWPVRRNYMVTALDGRDIMIRGGAMRERLSGVAAHDAFTYILFSGLPVNKTVLHYEVYVSAEFELDLEQQAALPPPPDANTRLSEIQQKSLTNFANHPDKLGALPCKGDAKTHLAQATQEAKTNANHPIHKSEDQETGTSALDIAEEAADIAIATGNGYAMAGGYATKFGIGVYKFFKGENKEERKKGADSAIQTGKDALKARKERAKKKNDKLGSSNTQGHVPANKLEELD